MVPSNLICSAISVKMWKSICLNVLLFAQLASAAVPPGYQDVMHCPPGYCRRYYNPQNLCYLRCGQPKKCYDPTTGDMVNAVWTGSLTDVVAPEGWTANPKKCPADWRLRWFPRWWWRRAHRWRPPHSDDSDSF